MSEFKSWDKFMYSGKNNIVEMRNDFKKKDY